MIFIKDSEEFDELKAKSFATNMGMPRKFPCFAYCVVTSYGMEEDTAEYLYDDDLRNMLSKIQEFTQDRPQ